MTTTIGIKVDDLLRERIRGAAQRMNRTPHWLIKQAVVQYVDALERGATTIRLFGADEGAPEDGAEMVQPTAQEVQPFLAFAQSILPQTELRAAITAAWHRPETECLPALLPLARTQDEEQAAKVRELATRLVREQHIAETSRATALVQRQVSALVMQNLSEGVLVLDDQFVVRNANPAGVRLLGAEATLTPPFSLLARPAWQALAALARRSFRQDAPQVADVNLISDDQSPIGLHVRTWLTAPGSAAPEASQQRLCVVFLHDLRELEARLRTEKLAAMGRMSAAVAHEIRNPLAAIVQANALLDEDLQDPTQKRLAQMIAQNADRLARIAEEILDIARVQHQIDHAAPSTVALDETVAQTWRDWQAQSPHMRRGTLQLGAPDMQVEFDAEHLRRVLVNLLDNALRFRSGDEESLQLQTRLESPGQASVQVWSDGAPMDQSVERHLFEPFFSSESRSSGLGLYICRGLCERHGASIGYQRTHRQTQTGDRSGNAFTVRFRGTGLVAPPDASLFDTIVV